MLAFLLQNAACLMFTYRTWTDINLRKHSPKLLDIAIVGCFYKCSSNLCRFGNEETITAFLRNKCYRNLRKAILLIKSKDISSDIKPNPSSGIYQFAEFLMTYIDDKTKKSTSNKVV